MGERVVPIIPTEEMWAGLARGIMTAFDMEAKSPRALLMHLKRTGHAIPQWLLDEPEMRHLDHTMSKGTRCVLIYRAMVEAAPERRDYRSFTDGMEAAAEVCGSLAETTYDDSDGFEAATGCEAAIMGVVRQQRAEQAAITSGRHRTTTGDKG